MSAVRDVEARDLEQALTTVRRERSALLMKITAVHREEARVCRAAEALAGEYHAALGERVRLSDLLAASYESEFQIIQALL